jgi:hypothetical protein
MVTPGYTANALFNRTENRQRIIPSLRNIPTGIGNVAGLLDADCSPSYCKGCSDAGKNCCIVYGPGGASYCNCCGTN